jgi:monoamine oxidase
LFHKSRLQAEKRRGAGGSYVVFLAGDWVSTGWPATMEGAVRSGYLAAEAVSRAAEKPSHFLQPDLTPTGFMRLLP